MRPRPAQSTGEVKWIDYARRSMQRPGYLKIVCALAPRTATSLERITELLESAVTRRIKIDPDHRESFHNYLSTHRIRRYGATTESAELQDLMLSDPRLPSSSGAITGELSTRGYRHTVYVEIPTWAIRLRLVRHGNHTVTDRGRSLIALSDAADQLTSNSPSTTQNPLLLSVGERYLVTRAIFAEDGDFLRRVAQRMLAHQGTFSRRLVGEWSAIALRELITDDLAGTRTGGALELRAQAVKTLTSLESQLERGDETTSSLGPLDSIATPRTEPLVDCGLLQKPDRGRFVYSVTPLGASVLGGLASCERVDEFIDKELGRPFITEQHGSSGRSTSGGEEPRFIADAYSSLRSGLGYVALDEVCALATALAVGERQEGVELRGCADFLRESVGEYGRGVRLTRGQRQGDFQVRISRETLEMFS